MKVLETDVLVIGSGIAGLSFARKAAAHGRVTLMTKKARAESSTNYAQGGIAAVMAPDDSVELHVRDTLVAGAGLCLAAAVRDLAREGPARVRELMEWGVAFTREPESLSLGREGGHSRRRIVHAGDLTGREIERALLATVAAEPAVTLLEDHVALDLVVATDPATGLARCSGALILDHHADELMVVDAALVFLATGGLGQAYRHTTNPAIATGDGIAMAFRAGARVANLEFVQFHPTALYPAGEAAFLISEAVRGEGAVLRRRSGEALMEGVHPHGSLAPRDVVARAIDAVLKETEDPYVVLDLSPIPRARIEERFPGILAECARRGVDIRHEPVPVVPAAHYACGGVWTDATGRSTLPGLFAAGEVACTGVHGANRLASNSLLEAVVYSHRAAESVAAELSHARRALPAPIDVPFAHAASSEVESPTTWTCMRSELRNLMWHDAGIVRSDQRLAHAATVLDDMQQRVGAAVRRTRPDAALAELRNLIEVSRLIVRSARSRKESRGLHYNRDYPYRDNERCLSNTVLFREDTEETSGWKRLRP
jgi:L-aspartate oxidase